VHGSIGKLSLKIPWTSLSTSPVVVSVQDVYVVAAPLNHRPYKPEKDEKLDRTRKRRFLQKVEGISVIKKVATSQNSKVSNELQFRYPRVQLYLDLKPD
jgi:hypothetical protein